MLDNHENHQGMTTAMLQHVNLSKMMTKNGGDLTLKVDLHDDAAIQGELAVPAEFRQFLQDIENRQIVVTETDTRIILADNPAEPDAHPDDTPLTLDSDLEIRLASPVQDDGKTPDQQMSASQPLETDLSLSTAVDSEAKPATSPGLQAPVTGANRDNTAAIGQFAANTTVNSEDSAIKHTATARLQVSPEPAISIPGPASPALSNQAKDTGPATAKASGATQQPSGTVFMADMDTKPAQEHDLENTAGMKALAAMVQRTTSSEDRTAQPLTSDKQTSTTVADLQNRVSGTAFSPDRAQPGPDQGGENMPDSGNKLPPAVPASPAESRGVEPESFQNTITQAVAGTARPLPASLRDNVMAAPQSQTYSLYSAQTAGTDNWRHEFAGQVRWLGENGIGKAEITLKPAELGSIEIRIMSTNDQTTVNFITSTSAARDTIEQSLPKLRELLMNSGLHLSDSSVAHQEQHDGSGNHKLGYRQRSGQADSPLEGTMPITETVPSEHAGRSILADAGRVDFYV